MDLYVDQDYMMELLDYITEAVIARNKALRRYYGQPEKSKSFGVRASASEKRIPVFATRRIK